MHFSLLFVWIKQQKFKTDAQLRLARKKSFLIGTNEIEGLSRGVNLKTAKRDYVEIHIATIPILYVFVSLHLVRNPQYQKRAFEFVKRHRN